MKLLLFICFAIPVSLKAGVDSIVITKFLHVDYPDTIQWTAVDSFSTGIHVGQYKHDQNHQPVSRTFYNWSQGKLIDSTLENFIDTAWLYKMRRENQFASNDSLALSTLYNFSFNGIDYDTSISRLIITMDTLTNTKMRTLEYLTGTTWNTYNRQTEVYDSLQRLTYYLVEDPFPQPGWDRTYHYLPNDSIDYYIYRQYQAGVLNDSDSIAYVYYANGYLQEAISFRPWISPGWQPDTKVSYTYDSTGAILSICNKLWIDSMIGWDCFGDTTGFTYNAFHLLQHRISSYCGLGGGSEILYFYDAQMRVDSIHLNSWPHSGNTHNYYWKFEYPFLTSVKDANEEHEFIFPNPASEWIRLNSLNRTEMLEVLDMTGRRVKICPSGFSVLDVSDLSPGLFILRVRLAEGRIKNFKFLKVE